LLEAFFTKPVRMPRMPPGIEDQGSKAKFGEFLF
jgi:hypothetical protein